MKNKRRLALLLVLTVTGNLWGCAPAATTPTPETKTEDTSSAAETTAVTGESAETDSTAPAKSQVKSRDEIPLEYQWDLTDMILDQEAFDQAASEAETKIAALSQWSGKLDSVEAIKAYLDAREDAQHPYTRISSYVSLMENMENGSTEAAALRNTVNKLYQLLSENTAFFNEEMSALPDSLWEEILSSKDLEPYFWELQCLNDERAHMLTEEQELMLFPLYKSINGADTLFSMLTNVDMEYDTVVDPEGNEIVADSLNRSIVLSENPDQAFRKEISETFYNSYGKYRNTLAQNMDNFIQAQVSVAKFQNYNDTKEAHMYIYHVNPEVYTNLISVVNNNLETYHKGFELRKKIMGLETLYTSDTSYPLSDASLSYPYETAKENVINAVAPLGTDYQNRIKKAFDEHWIDVYPTENKTQGAFCFAFPAGHPYVLLNQLDNYDSMSTMAHELGHAIHMDYAAEAQPSYYNQNATIFTTEVASTANEFLLVDYMLANAKTKEEKMFFLSQELSFLNSTFFTQAMFAEFEEAMYKCVEEGGTLTPDFLEETYDEINSKYYGTMVQPVENTKYSWSRIPHFYYGHYVYQYATSIAAACTVTKRIKAGEPGAVDDYLAYLKAGDSGSGVDLLKIAGVDMTSEHFADDLIERYNYILDEIEKLSRE